MIIECGSQKLNLASRTSIMGILNVTPDSFSDGGLFVSSDAAVARACQMVEEGADIIDVGGQSSRPGSIEVPAQAEMDKVLPVLEALAETIQVPISIDTYRASVAKYALATGACIVNDITALQGDKEMANVIAEAGAAVVLMHMQGTPRNMQANPKYRSVISDIVEFLDARIEAALAAGILSDRIIIDPGIGFGKTVEHNLEIMKRLREFAVLGKAILIGTSRKSFIGKVLDLPVDERLEGTAATVAIAICNGAHIVRVHDVKEMARVARMSDAIVKGGWGAAE